MTKFDPNNFKINKKHYIGDKRISTNLEDYSFDLATPDQPYSHQNNLMFTTPFGIFLKHQTLDSAVIGFNIEQDIAHCCNIQGGRGRFKQLTPIAWDKMLLENLIIYARHQKLDAITVLPYYLVEGDINLMNPEKLKKRYDYNAILNGFKFSGEERKFILELNK